jgi:uncharacterized protein YbjT (DUF2867 family)
VKIVVFGATGMVGQGVLRECLLASDVEEVVAPVRTPTGVSHPKLREARIDDFTDLSSIREDLAACDACFYCLGASSVGMDEDAYTRICYDFPMAAARVLAQLNPEATFVYVSGAGTNADGRQMWARVKGRTEQHVMEMLPNGYAFRPGIIQPRYGARSKVRWYNTAYTVLGPLLSLIERVAPARVTSTDRLGRAMLRAARTGFPNRVVANAELR